jgi:hypothetical protein
MLDEGLKQRYEVTAVLTSLLLFLTQQPQPVDSVERSSQVFNDDAVGKIGTMKPRFD